MPSKVTENSRILQLKAARERALQSPDLETLSMQPMAEMIGVSLPTLRGWCDKLSDEERGQAFSRGGLGKEYVFRPLATIDAFLGHFEAAISAKASRNRRLIEATGIEVDDDEIGDLEEIQRRLRLTMMITDQRRMQGEYTRTSQVADYLRGYNQTVVERIMGVGTKIDPTGQLPADVRAQVTEALREVAADVAASARAFIGELSAGSEQKGVGRSM
jgi:hypothetical protein